MSIKPLLLTVASLLVLAGCVSQKQIPQASQPQAGAGADTLAAAPVQPVPPRYYTTRFTFEANGVTATGQLRMQPDSIIWGSAVKIIELGRVRLTPDSVCIYAKVMNSCFLGTYNDLYHRFRYRTNFQELVETLRSEDAGEQIAAIARHLGLAATVKMEPWTAAEQTSFPFAIPGNAGRL